MLEQIKAMLLEEYSVSQWVLLFFLYSFCGWCWEVFLYLVKERRFVNRGFLFGPILPIYGFGAVGILLTCVPVEGNMALVALVGTIAASLLEYVTGFLMESIFHVRYWDYSQRPLNLNGYICALSAATWAVFSVIIVSVVNPFVKNYIYMIPLTMADAAAAVLVGFAVVDTGFAVRRALDLRALLESMERYAKELQALCRERHVPFIVNDNVDIALELDADGGHLGKEDMNPLKARQILGYSKIIGGTCNTFEDVVTRFRQQVDYIGLGPFTYTSTKKRLSPVLGLEGYRKIMEACRKEGIYLPVHAIGGIREDDIQPILNTGITGIALSSLLKNSEDITGKTRETMEQLKIKELPPPFGVLPL